MSASFKLLTEADLPPADVVPGRLLLGQRPELLDLTEGRIAALPQDERLLGALAAWRNALPPGLSVRWLEGGPGSGKSATLLKLAAALKATGPVVLVAHPEALAQAAREAPDALLVMDEPGEALQVDRVFLPLLDEGHPRAVLCAGPRGRASELKRALGHRLISQAIPLEGLVADDEQALRAFFERRTGLKATPGRPGTPPSRLILEWHTEHGAESADRLALALKDEAPALTAAAIQVLILNRLGAGACRHTVPEALVALRERLGVSPVVDRPGFWLAPSALAEVFHDALRDPADAERRRAELEAALLGALTETRTPGLSLAALRALLGALTSDPEPAVRLGLDEPEASLSRVLAATVERARRDPEALTLWVELADLGLTLEPDPAGLSLALLAEELPPGAGRLATALLRHVEGAGRALAPVVEDALLALLARAPEWPWWRVVASPLLARRPAEMAALVADYVEARPTLESARLLAEAVAVDDRDGPARALADRILAEAEPHPTYIALAEALVGDSGRPSAAVLTFCERSCTAVGVGPLLARLFRLVPDRARPWALSYLEAFPEAPNTHLVLSALLERAPDDRALLAAAHAWLLAGHLVVEHLTEQLLVLEPHDEGLAARARARLSALPFEHPGWPPLFQALMVNHQDEALLAVGQAWLAATSPSTPSWSLVFETLRRADRARSESAMERALLWLERSAPEAAGFGEIWLALRKATPREPRLLPPCLAWLATAPIQAPGFSVAFRVAFEAYPGEEDLLALGLDWLTATSREHKAWLLVWRALNQAAATMRGRKAKERRLLALGVEWLLLQRPDHPDWVHLWRELDRRFPSHEGLRAQGLRWLQHADYSQKSWGFVWRAVHDALPGEPLLASLGLRWLEHTEPTHPAWGFVWRDLVSADEEAKDGMEPTLAASDAGMDPGRARSDRPSRTSGTATEEARTKDGRRPAEPLLVMGRRWLGTIEPDNPGFAQVWSTLRHALPQDEPLAELGRRWLEAVRFSHDGWPQVFGRVRRTVEGDLPLDQLGLRWLTARPPKTTGWVATFRLLATHLPDSAPLWRLGLGYLESVSVKEPDWSVIWWVLWRLKPGDLALRKLGGQWLTRTDGRADDPRRLAVKRALDLAAAHITELDWLKSATDAPDWLYHWINLWEGGAHQAQLAPLGQAWMTTHAEHPLFASLFLRLWTQRGLRAALAPRGEAWLLLHPEARRADEVALALARFRAGAPR